MQDKCTQISRGQGRELRQGTGERQLRVHTASTGHGHRWSATPPSPGATSWQPKYGGKGKCWAGSKSVGFPEPNPPFRMPPCKAQMPRSYGSRASADRAATVFSGGQHGYINKAHSGFLQVILGPGAAQGSLRRLAGFYISRLARQQGPRRSSYSYYNSTPENFVYTEADAVVSFRCRLPTNRIICP